MILFMVEGPKGVGKTTLCDNLAKIYGAEVVHFDAKNTLTRNKLIELRQSQKKYIIDRGYLSYHIYSMIRNQPIEIEILEKRGDKLQLQISKALNFKDFEDLIHSIEISFITLYSSDVDFLLKNLNSRKQTTGKFASHEELSELVTSNIFFEHYGKYLLPALLPSYKSKFLTFDASKVPPMEMILGRTGK